MQTLSSSSRIEPSKAEDSRGDKLNYRADVDGLRAVAILGVILFHANLGVPGGFAGVDVFFVISGFLITRIVASEITAGSFSLLRFWERRARRIVPALAVVVVACLTAGYFLLLPFGFEVLGQTALSVVLLSSNFFFWKTNNYFSPDAKENPLLHTWSLGVEEQFYLLYPLLLLLLVPRGKIMAVAGLSAICAASLWCSVSWLSSYPVAAFYLLPSRAWEMGLGGLVALHGCRLRGWQRECLSWGGLLAVLASFALLSRYTPFPGWAALPAVAGTALVIWAGSSLAGKYPTTRAQPVALLAATRLHRSDFLFTLPLALAVLCFSSLPLRAASARGPGLIVSGVRPRAERGVSSLDRAADKEKSSPARS